MFSDQVECHASSCIWNSDNFIYRSVPYHPRSMSIILRHEIISVPLHLRPLSVRKDGGERVKKVSKRKTQFVSRICMVVIK